MKEKKRIIFISLIILGFVIISVLIATYKVVNISIRKSKRIQAEEPKAEFSYKVYDNMDENNIKVLVTATEENGIKEINYIDKSGSRLQIFANGKTKMSFDYIMKRNETYHFEMINSQNEVIEDNILVDEKFDDFSDDIRIASMTGGCKTNIEINNDENASLSYKLSNMSDYEDISSNRISVDGNLLKNNGDLDSDDCTEIRFIKKDEGGNQILVKKKVKLECFGFRETEYYITGDSLLQAVYDNKLENGNYTFIINGISYPAEVYNYSCDLIYNDAASYEGNNTADTRMLIVKSEKNIVVNSGAIVTPQTRKKGFFICADGDITNRGTITMTARGANAAGQNVYLWKEEGSYDGFTVPAGGAAGGERVSTYAKDGCVNGKKGNNGSNRQTGGGGSGEAKKGSCCDRSAHTAKSGAGSAGTSYSGGCGGGAAYTYLQNANGRDAYENGGTGGDGNIYCEKNLTMKVGGGVGNPGGYNYYWNSSSSNGYLDRAPSGTGGLLIMYSNTLNNYGTISSDGTASSSEYLYHGGCSGGGSVNIFTRNSVSNVGNMSANGGSLYGAGDGGNGCVTRNVINQNTTGETIDSIQILKNSINYEVNLKADDGKIMNYYLGKILNKYGNTIYDGSNVTGVETGYGTITVEDLGIIVLPDSLSLLTTSSYGDYINLGTNILNKSTTPALSDGSTIQGDWRIFYKDDTHVYAILSSYLPNTNSAITNSGLLRATYSEWIYSVKADSNENLINGLAPETNSAWNSLIPDSLKSKGAQVKGAVDLETWVKSWNQKYSTIRTTSTYVSLSSNAGYSDTLYFPYKKSKSNCEGYWLASPTANDSTWNVEYNGILGAGFYGSNYIGVRPVVSLPFDISVTATIDSTTGKITWIVE